MEEIEVKILEVDRHRVEDLLSGLGAKKVFDGEVETCFFDFEDRRITRAKNLLRLRKQNDKAELTFKIVHGNRKAKVAEEYSVEVSDIELTKKILGALGLSMTECMRKHRVSYKFDKAHIDFDAYMEKYAHIPEFLEIEAESAAAIHKYAGLLGFNPESCLPWSTADVVEYYSSKKENKQ